MSDLANGLPAVKGTALNDVPDFLDDTPSERDTLIFAIRAGALRLVHETRGGGMIWLKRVLTPAEFGADKAPTEVLATASIERLLEMKRATEALVNELLPAGELVQDNSDLDCEPPSNVNITPWTPKPENEIPPRDFLGFGHYIRGVVSGTIAPGATGKTANGLVEAVSLAAQSDFLLYGALYYRPLRVWYVNLEESPDEMERRLAAICKHYSDPNCHGVSTATPDAPEPEGGLDFLDPNPSPAILDAAALGRLRQNLFIDTRSTLGVEFSVAEMADRKLKIAIPLVEAVVAKMLENEIDLLLVDPFISSHRLGENENTYIDAVVKEAYRPIAARANAGVDMLHHVRKPRGSGESEIGADDARGASAWIDAIRQARTLNVMRTDDAEKYGIDPASRKAYFRVVSDAKPNMRARGVGSSMWRRHISVTLDNATEHLPADNVGVVKYFDARVVLSDDEQDAVIKLRADIPKLIGSGKRVCKNNGGDTNFKRLADKYKLKTKIVENVFNEMEDNGIIKYGSGKSHDAAGYKLLKKVVADNDDGGDL